MTSGANSGVDPFINIAARHSDYTDGNRPDNREWHEFGHHVMADTFANLSPDNPADTNHRGYTNPSTTNSWVEGFAEFYSMMVAREIAGEFQPDQYPLYRWQGWEDNLESNYLAWTRHQASNPEDPHPNVHNEELAVAGLLLDLVDPVDVRDATVLGGTTYADCVEVSFTNFLWSLLDRDWDDAVPRSPQAPADYGYIFDVKHLYDVLKLEGVGDRHSRDRGR